MELLELSRPETDRAKEDMAGNELSYGSIARTDETPLLNPSTRMLGDDGYPRKVQSWPYPLALALCILGIWRPGTAERVKLQRRLLSGRRRSSRSRGRSARFQFYCACGGAAGGGGSRGSNTGGGVDSNGNAIGDSPTEPRESDRAMDGRGHEGVGVDGHRGVSDGYGVEQSFSSSWMESLGTVTPEDMFCDVCFNKGDGKVLSTETTTTNAGIQFKQLLINITTVAYLVLITGLMTYDFTVYVIYFWGKRENTLFLVSYFTYLFQVIVVPVFCLLTRYMVTFRVFYAECTWATLHDEYILKRSQYLRGSNAISFVSLGLFLTWPTANGIIRLAYDYAYRPHGNAHSEISHWCALASYVMYGSFCYLIYVERRSFQHEFLAVVHFVARTSPMGDAGVDVCRDRLSAAYRQYRIMRDFVGIWMAFTMVVATWGITAHLTWNYVIFSYCDNTGGVTVGLPLLNLLIWSQKIMFFVLPSLAVGGINIDYIWIEFRYIVTNHQRHRYHTFWRLIRKHMSNLNLFGKGLSTTLVFSALGLYLGLELSNNSQNVAFWNGPGEFNISNYCQRY